MLVRSVTSLWRRQHEDDLRITPRSDREQALWRLAKEVAGTFDGLPWTVIGGVMVRIVEAQHGIIQSPYLTRDLDTILDLRADGASMQEGGSATHGRRVRAGPELSAGITYRFQREATSSSHPAPDNLGDRSTPTTVPPNVTIHADGGRGALNHTRQVVIDAGEGAFTVPLPDLVGAIVVKAQALETATAANEREKHRRAGPAADFGGTIPSRSPRRSRRANGVTSESTAT